MTNTDTHLSTPPVSSRGRTLAGGFLMGFANLVPGVSGGTMILALGLYDAFIGAIAELTRLRPSRRSLEFLAVLAVGLGIAVLALATPAVWLVTTKRWLAYSLFIGMTLGGVPLLWAVVRPLGKREVAAILSGVVCMAALAFGLSNAALPQTVTVFVLMGALAASSMILPGVSGSYILLIFGLYDVVVGSLRPGALKTDFVGSLGVIVPVGVGAVLGIGLLSNALKLLLTKFERPSHGVLLGLLLGSVLGLWPFQRAVHPELVEKSRQKAIAMLVAGEERQAIEAKTGVVFEEAEAFDLSVRHAEATAGDLKLLGLELETYRPAGLQAALSLLVVVGGFFVTRALGKREG